jgi:hypothetical protein
VANTKIIRKKFELLDLPQREDISSYVNSEKSKQNPASKINEPCERNCDCEIGLICYSSKCTDNW